MYSKLFWLDTHSNELWERLLLLLAPERGIWIRTHSMALLRNDPHKLVSLLAYTFVELDKDEKVCANNQFFEQQKHCQRLPTTRNTPHSSYTIVLTHPKEVLSLARLIWRLFFEYSVDRWREGDCISANMSFHTHSS